MVVLWLPYDYVMIIRWLSYGDAWHYDSECDYAYDYDCAYAYGYGDYDDYDYDHEL